MRTVAILGVTGRLGPAVARAFGGWRVRGLSRREPHPDEAVAHVREFVLGDRRDTAALARVVDGADLVVDLIGFDEEDAGVLVEVMTTCVVAPRQLIFASAMAEAHADDDYGRGKRAARELYERALATPVHTLVLPRLVAVVDHARRDQVYLDSAVGTGRALHRGTGQQRQTMAAVDDVATVARRVAEATAGHPAGPLRVGPRRAFTVAEAITALLEGAGIEAQPGRHPSPEWKGPHGGGDEVLDTSALEALFPELAWSDLLAVTRAHGEWLVRHPRPSLPTRPASR